MEKTITISKKSRILDFFEELSKKKEDTRKILETKLIKSGIIPPPYKKVGR